MSQLERANSLLIRLGEVAGVDPAVFRPEMTLDHELGIDRSELDPAARQVLDKYEIGERMQPFAYDVFAMMEEYVKKERWKQVADTMTPRPRGEEEWIDAIMGMTVAGWLAAFAQGIGSAAR